MCERYDLTEYQSGQLRLRCWEMLQGWGATDPISGIYRAWRFNERMKKAEELFLWSAYGMPEAPKEKPSESVQDENDNAVAQ